ncbi:MAG: hypothetical protein GXO93_00475, partial [FCB group bacterium]|nr:hypothetical protein [FCB group bacterium]
FEAEAATFQNAGIQIGSNPAESEKKLFNGVLSPFSINRRRDALQMACLYSLLFCFENEIRDLIRQTLEENNGPNWWDNLNAKTKRLAESRQKAALKDSWLEGEKQDLLGFVEFGMLGTIIIEKWQFFESIIPSQQWLKQRMDELEKARNFIAHNRMLLPSEFQRIYMYISDWNHLIGL